MADSNGKKAYDKQETFLLSRMMSRSLVFMGTAFDLLVYGYLVAVIVVLAIIWFTGDRWWFGTMLLYGPRWIYAFPMFALVPIALLWRRQSLWALGLSAIIIIWPLMGLNISLPITRADLAQQPFRVLTFNVERWSVSGEEFSDLLEKIQPDVAAVQELAPNRWPLPENWYVKRARTSVIVSRYPIIRSEILRRGPDVGGLYCVIATPEGPVGFANVDLLTPRRALKPILDRAKIFNLSQVDYAQERIADRWKESEDLFNWLDSFPESKKIIAGDFNLTVDSSIYRNVWSDYQNAFSQTEFGFGYTKKTKINIFRYKARIDHILSTPKLRPLRSWVGPDYGSDHLPLIADFAIKK